MWPLFLGSRPFDFQIFLKSINKGSRAQNHRPHELFDLTLPPLETRVLLEHLIHHLLSSGHGIRKIVNQNRYDIATELICSAFRTSWGLESDNWRNLCPEISLKDLVDGDQVCQQFLEEGFLELVPEEYLKLSENGLALADYITPYVLANLKSKIQDTIL